MPHSFSCASVLVASLATMGCLAAQTRVFTVDDDAPADFTTIQAAVNAAAPGDVVLVKDGDYVKFTIDGKGISVLADRDAAVRVLGTAGSMTSDSSLALSRPCHVRTVPRPTRTARARGPSAAR